MRRELPVVLTFIFGIVMILDYFVPIDLFNKLASEAQNWGIIISAFALGLGAANLMRIHSKQLADPKKSAFEKLNSAALMVGMWAFILIRIFLGDQHPAFNFMFTNIYSPMGSAMFAMLVFYIASAAYRAFRFRNIEAALLLLTGILVMFGNAPIGKQIWPQAPTVSTWVMKVPNVAGQRGIMISAAVGAISTSLRVLLGIERGYLGGTSQ